MNIMRVLSDVSALPDEEAIPVATALLSLLIAQHPAIWEELVGDRSVVGFETVIQFMRLAFDERGAD